MGIRYVIKLCSSVIRRRSICTMSVTCLNYVREFYGQVIEQTRFCWPCDNIQDDREYFLNIFLSSSYLSAYVQET